MRATRPSSVFVVTTLLAAAVLVTACAPEPVPPSTPDQSEEPTATETATPGPVDPVVAFDGDCSAVLDTTALSAAMDQEMSFWEPQWVTGADAELGGVTCGWVSTEYAAAFATVWAYPVDALDPAFISNDAANSCAVDEPRCVISGVFGETWIGVSAYSDRSSEQIEMMRPLLAEIGERAAAFAPQPLAGSRAGWWTPVPSCEDIAASLSAGGTPSMATDDRPTELPQFVGGPVSRGCSIEIEKDGEAHVATVYLNAGAGAGLDSVLTLDPSARVDYEARTFATASEQYPIDGNPGLLLGTDGVNLVQLLRNGEADATARDAALLDTILTALEN